MPKLSYEESVQRGVAHVGEQLFADKSIDLLNAGKGSRRGCMGHVHTQAQALSLLAWFRSKDLHAHKQWAYVAAKVRCMTTHMQPWEWFPAYNHLFALLSDNDEVLDWMRQHRAPYFQTYEDRGDEAVNKDDPRTSTFHGYQALLALNGNWKTLHRRCEQILATPDNDEWTDWLVDHRFYLALAEGDKRGMEAALNELTSPDVASIRNFGQAFGLTENLIATHATLYAKMAWHFGFEIEVKSPWVPKEWLPVQPLENYEDPWPFMQRFDLWQPFEDGWEPWSPRRDVEPAKRPPVETQRSSTAC